MTHKPRTAGVILSDRICKRLADIATAMANDKGIAWRDYRDCFRNLNEKSFQVIYDTRNFKDPLYRLIENAVNENTHQQVKDTQGEFFFDQDFENTDDLDGYTLITFNPEHCTDSRDRYAALMVAQRFENDVESTPSRLPGGLLPAGTRVLHMYGIISTMGFMNLATAVNPSLGKHALPEDFAKRVDFTDTPAVKPPQIKP